MLNVKRDACLVAVGLFVVPLALTQGCGDGDETPDGSTTSGSTTTTSGGPGGAGTGGDGTGGDGGNGAGGGGIVTDADCSPPQGAQGNLTLTEFATGLGTSVFLTHPPGDDRLFVVDQGGEIFVVQTDGSSSVFVDIDENNKVQTGGERGLLGLAFHPDYANNGRFFVHYSGTSDGRTVIEEYKVSAGDPDVADPTPVQTLLEVDQPAPNHNGGSIEFSPLDGYLYIGLGDGGGSGDPFDQGQDKNTLLAALLRIDVDQPDMAAGKPYSIPAGNPTDGAPEIFHWGLRNPYRFDFDPCTADLYIADVGQNAFEEIDIAAPGVANLNWGWPIMEGNSCYQANMCNMDGLSLPALDYPHPSGNEGRSVTGGAVYRGSAIPWLRGAYLFADFVSSEIWMTRWDGATATPAMLISDDLFDNGTVSNIVAIGQDRRGEVYVVSASGTIFRVDPQ